MGKELDSQLLKSKNSIIHDTKQFDQPNPDPHKCEIIATSILNLLSQGVDFTKGEISDVFFRASKLFRSKGSHLRRLVYLLLKSLPEEQAFIVTSSLTSDMNEKSDAIRANAIRALGVILDASTAPMFERYIKTGIVEKNPHVAAAALACGIKFTTTVPDVVKRWITEVTQALESPSGSVQHLALVLLHFLRKQDKLALHKLVVECTKRQWNSVSAEVLLIRLASEVIMSSVTRGQQIDQSLMDFLNSSLRARSNTKAAVQLEALKVFVTLVESEGENASASCDTTYGVSLSQWLSTVQMLLTSQSPATRYGAVKALSRLANVRPQFASRLNPVLENLMSDENRPIAGLALTILLKTVQSGNVDGLIRQMSHVMTDAPASLKLEAVNAVRSLCIQYPTKYRPIFSFINTHLREDGGVELKRAVVHALMELTEAIPDARELGLAYLCEYIEDCEFATLCAKVLSFIARVGPSSPYPSKFVRFIYNRILLENAAVRASAVDALTRIAIACPSIRKDVSVLLETSTVDADDEVRQRTLDYSALLQPCLVDSNTATTAAPSASPTSSSSSCENNLSELLSTNLPVSLDALCENLLDHLTTPEKSTSDFDFGSLPTAEQFQTVKSARQLEAQLENKRNSDAGPSSASAVKTAHDLGRSSQEISHELYAKLNSVIPSSTLGALLASSSRPQQLSEAEADFGVTCKKHFFAAGYIVCEVSVTNTLEDVHLRSVGLELSQYDGSKWTVLSCVPIVHVKPQETDTLYLVLQKKDPVAMASIEKGGLGFLPGQFTARLRYHSCDDEDDLEGFEDIYGLDALKISSGDHFRPRALKSGEFKVAWESFPADQKVSGKALRLPAFTGNLVAAVNFVIKAMNMSACDGCQNVSQAGGKVHALYLSGTSVSGASVLIFAQIAMHEEHGCLLKMTAASKDKDTAEAAVEPPK